MSLRPRLVPLLLTLIVAGCGSSTPTASSAGIVATPSATTAATPSPSVSQSPAATASPSPVPVDRSTANAGDCAVRAFDKLTLEQRVGQLFMIGLTNRSVGAAERNAVASYHFGSVWFAANNTSGSSGVRAMTTAVQAMTGPSTTGNIHFFVAADQEGGQIQRLRGAGFSSIPTALVQGTLLPSELTTDAVAWGQELFNAGVNVNLAPVADVVPAANAASNEPIGALQREYGHDPAIVGIATSAYVTGMSRAGVATTLKHFPGLGRVGPNTDDAPATDTKTTRGDPYLTAFGPGIRAGAPMVMISLASYPLIDPDHNAFASSEVIGTLLRGELGFRGLVLSDELGVTGALADQPVADRAIDFIVAGGDMIVVKTVGPAAEMAEALVAMARRDPAFAQRIDESALRVLRTKHTYGLIPCG